MFFVGGCGALAALFLVPIVIVPGEEDGEFSLLADDISDGSSSIQLAARRGFSVSCRIDSIQSYGTMAEKGR